MFTGLISSLGVVEAITKGSEYAKLTIKDAKICGQIQIGDSVSVNGTCLSVTAFDNQHFSVDVMVQTLKLTAIGVSTYRNNSRREDALCSSPRINCN
jgi:riboflavin synthase